MISTFSFFKPPLTDGYDFASAGKPELRPGWAFNNVSFMLKYNQNEKIQSSINFFFFVFLEMTKNQ